MEDFTIYILTCEFLLSMHGDRFMSNGEIVKWYLVFSEQSFLKNPSRTVTQFAERYC